MVMAVLDSSDIAHPPIEALFTIDEEVGMTGAKAVDWSLLKGRTLINIDSEEEGSLRRDAQAASNMRQGFLSTGRRSPAA